MKQPLVTLLSVGVMLLGLVLGTMLVGCFPPGEDNDTTTTTTASGGVATCIPCGDMILTCNVTCEISGCPKCFMEDEDTGGVRMVFDDDSYYLLSEEGFVFFDSTGAQCYAMTIDAAENKTTFFDSEGEECYSMASDAENNTVMFIVNDSEYTFQDDGTDDGLWICPDGSTWELPPGCEGEADYEELDAPDVSACPPVMTLCDM